MVLSKTLSAGGTLLARQHLRREWTGVVLGRAFLQIVERSRWKREMGARQSLASNEWIQTSWA